MTYLKAFSRGSPWPRISSCLKNSPRVMKPLRRASIAGPAETGNSCPGFSGAATPDRTTGNRVRIPIIGRWKILDNLRRTLSAPAALLLLVAGWVLRPASPWVWTSFILATVAIPALLPFFLGLIPRRKGISLRSHFRGVLSDLVLGACQIGLVFTFLTYQAWLMADAILRTLGRLFITHRNMLEWVTAAQSRFMADSTLSGIYRRMAGGIAVACCVDVGFGFWTPPRLGSRRLPSSFSGLRLLP